MTRKLDKLIKKSNFLTLNLLLMSSLVNIVLLIFRVVFIRDIYFVFLVWNLFLAWIPFMLSFYLLNYGHKIIQLMRYFLFFCWFLFLPNTFYIVTDIFHLTGDHYSPLWFDLILVLSFAVTGVLLGLYSLYHIHLYFGKRNRLKTWVMIVVIVFLSSFGIYIGRYLRWNSWDVLTNPFLLIRDIGSIFIYPGDNLKAFGITFIYSFVFLSWYLIIYLSSLKK
ncbi:MAG: DUF1361 domain-containing protein [Candidatus Moranbacteria bacterium]|nr:DUF1361 domain-containing protein [Candidatus Moranbacteria bacterium]